MNISILELVKKIPRFTGYVIQMLFFHFIAIFYKNKEKYKNAWLICERGTEARDNAYWLFKYIRENYPEKKVYYIIDYNNKIDLKKIEKLGNSICYNSFEHRMAFIFSKIYISTHIGYITNWNYLLYKKLFDRKNKKKYVFLQHGITKDDISNIINKKINQIDLVITAIKKERESILNNPNYGYNENEVALTGFARFDNLINYEIKEQILLMPTWRNYLVIPSYKKQKSGFEECFLNSKYYMTYYNLLKNERLHNILKKYKIKLIFYPHYEMQKYIKYFNIENDNIVVASKEENDVQTLLKESKILITDYSSVYFDFAYMEKPEIFYQFDKTEFSNNQYKQTNKYEEDAFGVVVAEEETLLDELENILKNNCKMEEKYIQRVKNTFIYKDDQNCKRIYEEILKLDR